MSGGRHSHGSVLNVGYIRFLGDKWEWRPLAAAETFFLLFCFGEHLLTRDQDLSGSARKIIVLSLPPIPKKNLVFALAAAAGIQNELRAEQSCRVSAFLPVLRSAAGSGAQINGTSRKSHLIQSPFARTIFVKCIAQQISFRVWKSCANSASVTLLPCHCFLHLVENPKQHFCHNTSWSKEGDWEEHTKRERDSLFLTRSYALFQTFRVDTFPKTNIEELIFFAKYVLALSTWRQRKVKQNMKRILDQLAILRHSNGAVGRTRARRRRAANAA